MRYLAGLGLAEMEEVDEEEEPVNEEEVEDDDEKIDEEKDEITERSAPIKHFLRNYKNASQGLTLVQEKMNNKCGLQPTDVDERQGNENVSCSINC